MATKKNQSSKSTTLDLFQLPFEVFYSGPINVYSYEFKSDVKVKRFKDVKAVTQDVGQSWGLRFLCPKNMGPELYCCLVVDHSELDPDWLIFDNEENIEFNSSTTYRVKIKGKKISFVEDDEIEELEDLEICTTYSLLKYEIGDIEPDFIILDALGTRLKINCAGFALDNKNNPIESQRIFNLDEIDPEKYSNYSSCDFWRAQSTWVKQTLEADFPKDIDLFLA